MHWTEEQLADYQSRQKQPKADPLQQLISAAGFTGTMPKPKKPALAGSRHGKAPGPNKTESEYGRMLQLEFPNCKIRYEALSFTVDLDGDGFRYTPDWVVYLPSGGLLCVEVKNAGYKHASYGRAKLAFAATRDQWPMFDFRWAEKEKSSWSIRNY